MLCALVLLLAASPATFDQSYREGLIALQQNRLDAAELNLTEAARLQPRNARVWLALAQTYRKSHAEQKAEDAVKAAAQWGQADSVVLRSLVVYFSEAGRPLEAAGAQAGYAALNPADAGAAARAAELYFEASQPLLQRQQFSDAARILETARARLGPDAQLELALGVAYYGLRRFDDAAARFLAAIELAPDAEQPYLFLARMLGSIPARLPEVTRRFAAFEAANPGDARAYLLHAQALDAQAADPAEARLLLLRSIALDASNPAAHVELGTVLERLRQYPEAAAEFERAAALDASDASTHYHLSRLYLRLNRPADAAAEGRRHAELAAAEDGVR